eukprot:COSAG02_NODE_24476_length_687_cov_0.840136_1_plen_51_part_01
MERFVGVGNANNVRDGHGALHRMMRVAACVSVLLAVVGATDYEEGSFAGLA